MKNGIIINGKQYELQELDQESMYSGEVCATCSLKEICNVTDGTTLCILIHNANIGQVYRYIGDVEDDKNRQ